LQRPYTLKLPGTTVPCSRNRSPRHSKPSLGLTLLTLTNSSLATVRHFSPIWSEEDLTNETPQTFDIRSIHTNPFKRHWFFVFVVMQYSSQAFLFLFPPTTLPHINRAPPRICSIKAPNHSGCTSGAAGPLLQRHLRPEEAKCEPRTKGGRGVSRIEATTAQVFQRSRT